MQRPAKLKCSRLSGAGLWLAKQGPHAQALRNSGRAFLGPVPRPFEDLLQANLMLRRWVAIDEDGKLGHRARARRTASSGALQPELMAAATVGNQKLNRREGFGQLTGFLESATS